MSSPYAQCDQCGSFCKDPKLVFCSEECYEQFVIDNETMNEDSDGETIIDVRPKSQDDFILDEDNEDGDYVPDENEQSGSEDLSSFDNDDI